MEDHQNPLRFETSPYHNVVIKDRKSMELSGVKQIDSFDSSEFLLETTLGWMLVSGKDLTLSTSDAGQAGYRSRRCDHQRQHRLHDLCVRKERTGARIAVQPSV